MQLLLLLKQRTQLRPWLLVQLLQLLMMQQQRRRRHHPAPETGRWRCAQAVTGAAAAPQQPPPLQPAPPPPLPRPWRRERPGNAGEQPL
jgi:hypothetical protein